eukprot:TRINITY_DN3976_c0_g1_i1.p1 TRINITY_DN3976_c0_g1~~TRINITY_DN3976_c0_g1_i1.p1  ORF type:complete len:815 (-),score=146.29 TRINITY_DN3976_c0_g1_i1:376-2820(-)
MAATSSLPKRRGKGRFKLKVKGKAMKKQSHDNNAKRNSTNKPQQRRLSRIVDPQTAHYFGEIASLLEKSSTSAEERAILCSNALEESRGKEFQLICDKVFSVLFENLLMNCEKDQLCGFLSRIIEIFPSIAVDASGSHVAEAALKSLALLLQDQHSNIKLSVIEQLLSSLCEVLSKNATGVMCNQYGSHVLRSFLTLLNGTLLDSLADSASSSKSGLAERIKILTQSSKKKPETLSLRAFPHLLKLMVHKILEACRGNICVIRVDRFASLVLQTALQLLGGDNNLITNVISIALDCPINNLKKEGNMLEGVSAGNILELIMDPIGSRLMEVILTVAPDSLFMEILNRFFRHSLFEIGMHEVANFVLQSLISNSRDEGQVNMIWDEIGAKFPDLLKSRKAGVIASLISACFRFHTHEHECCRSLAHAVVSAPGSSNYIVPRILHLENFFCSGGSDWQWPSETNMSVLGCVLLQIIFKYPSSIIQQYCSSFVSMSTDQILEVAKDPGGSRVIESFLLSKAPSKHKFRVISKLRGHFGELAQHPLGSFTVAKLFSAANLSLKEVIAAELVIIQTELSRSKHGLHLLRACDVSRYAKGPEKWRTSQSSKQSARASFAEVFGSAHDDEKEIEYNPEANKDESTIASAKPKKQEGTNKRQDGKPRDLQNWSKEDILKLEHSMAVLGFPVKKVLHSYDLDSQAETVKNGGEDNGVKDDITLEAEATTSSEINKDVKRQAENDIDQIFSKKGGVKKQKAPKKSPNISKTASSIELTEPKVDNSVSDILDILENKKKKKKKNVNEMSGCSINKQSKGRQIVFM